MRLERLPLGGKFGDLTLGYVDWGPADADRTVVCVHGLTRNARDFDALAAALAGDDVRVLAVDVAGRGRSDRLSDPALYTNPAYAGHLRRFLGLLGLAQVDWIGTSMGGIIGMLLAAGEASPVGRLVLNDIGPFVPKEAVATIQGYVGLNPRFDSLAALEIYLREIHAGFGPLTDAQWQHLARHSARQDADGWRLSYDPAIRRAFASADPADVDLWPLWDAITCPVLVLRGEHSALLTAEVAKRMIGRGPRVALCTIPHSGHAPALMAADQIALIQAWLAS